MRKMILITISILASFYVVICGLLFLYQEKLIFFPQPLDKTYQFDFTQKFEELNIPAKDGKLLNGLLFKADSTRGVIYYLHGNAGSLASWGEVASTYTTLGYDVFIIDYRGFGKSEGSINGQKQLFQDVQTAYDTLKTRYSENEIIVLGYSIGTGPASKLASANHPKLLILQAPYFSLTDMMRHKFPVIPTFLLKYQFATNRYLPQCNMPVVIFHGDKDEVIYYESSVKLKQLFKKQDTLITLRAQVHNGITENPEYQTALKRILNQY